MKILIIGSGGREHALTWKLSQSLRPEKIFVAPGNAGTHRIAKNIDISPADFNKIKQFCLQERIDMIVIGPEAPLVDGLHDSFKEDSRFKNTAIIGPVARAAMLEGSKAFAKQFMRKYNIPTARYITVGKNNMSDAIEFLNSLAPPYVLKADGLAAGKGVLIIDILDEAVRLLEEMLHGKFGDASKEVVIEEHLNGIELSCFVLTDGISYVVLPEAKDYKRIGEGDTGLNTGGMGAVSPVPFADKAFLEKVENRIIKPTIDGLNSEGITYQGFIFFGLMKSKDEPYVIEYNARMGDPEAEVVLPRIQNDLVDLFDAVAKQQLDRVKIDISPETVATVMLVSGGYPGKYEKEKEIFYLDKVKNSTLFHAGTKIVNNKILTSGGRVIAVSSYGKDMTEALEKCYQNAKIVDFEKKYYRHDIGFDL